MKHFNFDLYKESKQYFQLFDVYIKQFEKNKENVFNKLNINNSSYRRARDNEQTVGREIIKKLSDNYDLKIPSDSFIDKLEKKYNFKKMIENKSELEGALYIMRFLHKIIIDSGEAIYIPKKEVDIPC